PIARAIVKKAEEKNIGLRDAGMFRTLPGRGAEGTIEGKRWFVGSSRLFAEHGVVVPENDHADDSSIEVYIGSGSIEGSFTLSDTIRKQSLSTLQELRDMGIGEIVLLTGDRKKTAESIAHGLGMDAVHPEISPEQKADIISLLKEGGGKSVMMVGDGINDAPALKAADIGMAIGTEGSDIAIESANAALLVPDISLVPKAVMLGKKTVSRIKENIALSIGIKFLFLFLAVAGYSTLWMAIAADMGTSLIVILNGMRLRNG
ncbi:MAG: cation-translocating P-type ATPase, partial [Deltaproteobacteria bacterium]|nr:cation-translocating P-type ATPase [Deltaproteobacteria bacterium]